MWYFWNGFVWDILWKGKKENRGKRYNIRIPKRNIFISWCDQDLWSVHVTDVSLSFKLAFYGLRVTEMFYLTCGILKRFCLRHSMKRNKENSRKMLIRSTDWHIPDFRNVLSEPFYRNKKNRDKWKLSVLLSGLRIYWYMQMFFYLWSLMMYETSQRKIDMKCLCWFMHDWNITYYSRITT